jgi:hypothetical protein
MALLPEAIRASDATAARRRLPDGGEVVVERVIGKEEPYSEESYWVHVYDAAGARLDEFVTGDLVEAIERLRGLDFDGFDPDAPEWEPTVGPRNVDATPVIHAP